MDKKIITSYLFIVVLVAFILLISVYSNTASKSAKTDTTYQDFASCVADKATFYGAFWCPACASQKSIFAAATENLTYVECSKPDRNDGQTQVCIDEGVTSYPTWKTDTLECSGGLTPEALSNLTGCELPDDSYRQYRKNIRKLGGSDSILDPFEAEGVSTVEAAAQLEIANCQPR